MSRKILCWAAVISLAVLSAACRSVGPGGRTYATRDALRPLEVYRGTVTNVDDVTIEADETGIGAVAGGVVGGIVGDTIGRGRGRRLARTGGVLGGAAAGSAVERARGTLEGVELEVELDNGRTLVIVQIRDDVYAVGDRVRVLEAADGTMRVRH